MTSSCSSYRSIQVLDPIQVSIQVPVQVTDPIQVPDPVQVPDLIQVIMPIYEPILCEEIRGILILSEINKIRSKLDPNIKYKDTYVELCKLLQSMN